PKAQCDLHGQVLASLRRRSAAGESLLGRPLRSPNPAQRAPSPRDLIWESLEELGSQEPGTEAFSIAAEQLAEVVKPHGTVPVPEVVPEAWDPSIPQDLPDPYVRGAEAPDAEPLEPVERLVPPENMFVSLEAQAANIEQWNSTRNWGLTPDDFAGLDLTPTTHEDPLVVDLLAVYLDGNDEMDGIRRTCRQLWQVAAERQPNAWSWDWYWDGWLGHPMPVRLVPGIEHRPGLRRVTLDLGAHWRPGHYTRPCNIRGPDSAHAEALVAAAQFPEWVRSMDGQAVPYIWVSGYQVTMVERAAHRRLPTLAWSGFWQRLSFVAHWADYSQSTFSSPTCVEVDSEGPASSVRQK
ncbi:MAG: hypothetical protein ACRDX8_14970, partial [Acidimicrobiales bacterium]